MTLIHKFYLPGNHNKINLPKTGKQELRSSSLQSIKDSESDELNGRVDETSHRLGAP